MFSAGTDLSTIGNLFFFPHPYPTTHFTANNAAATVAVKGNSDAKDDQHVALIISGGGSTGAWAVGALRYLLFEWPHPDPKNPGKIIKGIGTHYGYVCGTSTGSLIAPMLMTNDPDQLKHNLDILEAIYTTAKTENVFTLNDPVNMLSRGSVLENDGLKRMIQSIFNWSPADPFVKMMTAAVARDKDSTPLPPNYKPVEWGQLIHPALDKKLILATACLQTSQAAYFYVAPQALQTYFPYDPRGILPEGDREYDQHMGVSMVQDPAMLMEAMLASASDPTLFPSVQVKPASDKTQSASDREYSDGGLEDFAPIEIAAMNGATTIYAVILSPLVPDPENDNYHDLLNGLGRTIDLFSNRVGFANVQEAEDRHVMKDNDRKTDIKYFMPIRPDKNITDNSNVFIPQNSVTEYGEGHSRAEAVLNDPVAKADAESVEWIRVRHQNKKHKGKAHPP